MGCQLTSRRCVYATEKSGLFRIIFDRRCNEIDILPPMFRGRLVSHKPRRVVKSIQILNVPCFKYVDSIYIGRRFPTVYSTDVKRKMATSHRPAVRGNIPCRRRYLVNRHNAKDATDLHVPVRCDTRINLHSHTE